MAHLNKFQLIFIMTVLKEQSTKEGDETSSNIAILPLVTRTLEMGPIVK